MSTATVPPARAGLHAADRGGDDDDLGTELAHQARQQRRHVHPVSLVEVHAPEERRHRHAGEVSQREPSGVARDAGWREARKVGERERRLLVERVAERRPEPRTEDDARRAGPAPMSRGRPSRRARRGRRRDPAGRGSRRHRSRERGLQALDDRDRRGVDAATRVATYTLVEVPDHDERHQPRERRRPARREPPRPRTPAARDDVVGEREPRRRAAGARRRDGARPRRSARRTAPSIPRPRCGRAPTSRTRTPAPCRSRSSGSSSAWRRPRRSRPRPR